MISASSASTGSADLSVPPSGELDSTGHPAPRPHGRPWGCCTEAVIDRTLHSATGSPRATGRRRPVAAPALLALLLAGQSALAADWSAGAQPYYPGPAVQPGHSGGSYRPTDSTTGQWQWQPGAGSGSAQASLPIWGQGGAYAPTGQPQAYPAEPWNGRSERITGEYRFRPRPDDKAAKSDDSPRYRPDAELARRSQQFWGLPGQDSSQYGGAPGAVFRPLRPEQEPATTRQYGGQPAGPPWSGLPTAPSTGYGYPY